MSTIYLDNGIKITTYPRPPVELDPMTASREELVRAGMPARPTHPDALACYERFFTSTKDRFHYIEPTFKPMPGPPGHAPITADMAKSTNNWSGVSVRTSTDDPIKSVSAQWEVPDVIFTGDEGTSWENAASWIGIDGTPDGGEFVPLRAGVVSTITEDGTTVFFAFAGWDPAAGAQITNLEVKAKDTVIVSICSANGINSQLATIHFAIQHGAATSFQLSAPSGSLLLGANAEFVVTKQNLFGIPVGFPNYGTVRFVDATALTFGNKALPTQNGDTFDLMAGGRTVSTGVGLPNNVVQCTYLP